ncbi:MAG: hypothetical protein ACYCWW_07055 [Deltaproteobacteria bacterium]
MTCLPSFLYKLRLPLACTLAAFAVTALAEKTSHGALLPPGAREVGQDRFRSPEVYQDTLKFYAKTYSAEHFPRSLIADLPGVRAEHIANPSRREGWEGLNVYELNGETRIFVLARAKATSKRRKKESSTP